MNSTKRFALITATTLVAVIGCAPTLPDLRPPVEINRVIPDTDIPTNSEQMLNAHKEIRQQLSIPPLRWSNQMSVYATEWAIFLANDVGCDLRHRGAIGLPLHKNGIGENLYKHSAVVRTDGDRQIAAVNEKSVVLEWARESVNYDYSTNNCALNNTCDRYTQLVWRDSSVVGCGAASCPNKDQIWVCNYDPPGNYNKQRPY